MSKETELSMQTILSMAMLTLTAAGEKETIDKLTAKAAEELKKLLDSGSLQEHIGKWTCLWGPVVWSHKGDSGEKVAADNSMFVARLEETEDSREVLCVSLMGTNPISSYGWFVEDFNVSTTVPWKEIAGTPEDSGEISKGTYTGFNVHNNIMKYKGQSLMDFLKDRVTDKNKSYEIYVTGHSLGGPLAVTTALYLNAKRELWDNGCQAVVKLYPFAGATAGEEVFAAYGEKCKSDLFFFENRYWNQYDVVPHVWRKVMIEKIRTLYTDSPPRIPTTPEVNALVDWAIKNANGIKYYHINEESSPLKADKKSLIEKALEYFIHEAYKLLEKIYKKILPEGDFRNTISFFLRVAWEHSIAYFILLDMLDILMIMLSNLAFADGIGGRLFESTHQLIKEFLHPKEELAHMEEVEKEVKTKISELLKKLPLK